MLPEKDNEAKTSSYDKQPITALTSEEELTPQQEQEVIERSKRLIEEFDERHQPEDDSMDIIHKP